VEAGSIGIRDWLGARGVVKFGRILVVFFVRGLIELGRGLRGRSGCWGKVVRPRQETARQAHALLGLWLDGPGLEIFLGWTGLDFWVCLIRTNVDHKLYRGLLVSLAKF